MQIAASTNVVIVVRTTKTSPTSQAMANAVWQSVPLVLDDRDGLLGIEMGVYGAPETFR